MFDVKLITDLHQYTAELWHRQDIANPYEGLLKLVCEQHKYNFLLWHEEDIARSPDVSDRRIAEVKRSIDRYNQQRNDWIEKIDDYLFRTIQEAFVTPSANLPFNSETPGSIIDRLSILALRIYHMEEQAERRDASTEHRQQARKKLNILHVQHQDLAQALSELLDDLVERRKQLKLYRQFKMYNDPALNPYLYERKKRAS